MERKYLVDRPRPNQGTGPNQLRGVSCLATASCNAVGAFGAGITTSNGNEFTLIESYS